MVAQRIFNTLLMLMCCRCAWLIVHLLLICNIHQNTNFPSAATIMTFLLCTLYYRTPAIMRNTTSFPSFSPFRPSAPFKGASRPGNFALRCYCCCCLSERRSVVWAVPFFLLFTLPIWYLGKGQTQTLCSLHEPTSGLCSVWWPPMSQGIIHLTA